LTAARRNVANRDGRPSEPLAFSRAMFEHACGYTHVYRALVGSRGGLVAINEIRRVLSDLVKDELDAMREDCPVSRERAVRFVVGTFLTVLTWLLERKPKVSTAEVDEMFRRHEKKVGLRPQISPRLDVNAIRGCLQVTATVGGVRSLAKHLSQYRPVSL
jgi:hypothetical protein